VLVSNGFTLDDIRWNMTMKDFKTYLIITLKQKLDEQRTQSMLLLMTLGSLISKEVGKQAQDLSKEVAKQSEDLTKELEDMYIAVVDEEIVNTPEERAALQEVKRQKQVEEREKRTWKLLQKLDIGFAKITGAPTNAPWAVANAANLQSMDTGSLLSQVGNRMPVGRG